MDDRQMKEQVRQLFDHTLSGIQEDPWLANRVMNADDAGAPRRRGRSKRGVLLVLVLCLALTATVGIAWTLSRAYFEEIADLTVISGDYADWSLAEKRAMMQIMGKYGLIPEEYARRMSRKTEAEIDAFMLERYGAESAPDDLGWISLQRIADVELGSYVHWDNDTWIWYTNMMLETGLWDETDDIDLFFAPGEEAVSPETAMANARRHLLANGVSEETLNSAQVIWTYMTHASDTERKHLSYWVTFLYPDQSEHTVRVLPDGAIP